MKLTSANKAMFVVAIIFSAETVSAGKTTVPFYRKSEKIVLSYDDYRRIRPVKQAQWTKAIQEFYVNLEKIENGQRTGYVAVDYNPINSFDWLSVKAWVPKICTTVELLFSSQAAHATLAEQIEIKKLQAIDFKNQNLRRFLNSQYEKAERRLKEEQDYLATMRRAGAAAPSAIAEQVAKINQLNLAKIEAGAKFSRANSSAESSSKSVESAIAKAQTSSALKLAEKANAKAASMASAELKLAEKANIKAQADINRLKVLAEEKLVEYKKTDKAEAWLSVNKDLDKAKSEGDRTTRALSNANKENQKYNKSVTTTPASTKTSGGVKTADGPDYASPTGTLWQGGDKTEAQNLKEFTSKEEAGKARNTCIYAGWIQQVPKDIDTKNRASRCPRVTKMTLGKVNYSCESTSDSESSTLRMPATNDPEATILCNPVVFGLVNVQTKEPLCVKPSSSVTAECAKQSGSRGLDPLEALKLHPNEYRVLTTRITSLCTGDREALTSHFQSLGVTDKRQIENSINDLGQTCDVLKTQLSEVDKRLDSSSTSEGGV